MLGNQRPASLGIRGASVSHGMAKEMELTMKLGDLFVDELIIKAWARTIIHIPNECSRAKEDSRKEFKELIGESPEEFLKRK